MNRNIVLKEEGASPAEAVRAGIVRLCDAIRDVIMYFKWYRPMSSLRDLDRRLEKRLLFELIGVRYGGMAMSGAYVEFRKDFYDTLATDREKNEVRRALFWMLRSGQYAVSVKQMIAFVCADLNMEEAAADIALVQEAAARNMSMRDLYRFKQEQARELKRRITGTAEEIQ
jgi:hypothetical protein